MYKRLQICLELFVAEYKLYPCARDQLETRKQFECAVRTESIYQSVENLREGTTKNTKHQKTLTAAQISRSMRH
jgi:hypothetical protein